ncbi:metallophosphoesterase [bacterium]|nr:MAG: metallophosphoesterase [bacterium]
MPSSIFAVVGDVHGAMWTMIRLLSGWEKSRKRRLDFVLQVGDFEPHRDEDDLSTMAAPAKYRDLGDFPLFASGGASFPWPIWFIGGNHEPYGWLSTMEMGGEVAPNCSFIGRANIISVGGIRVAGLSGIFRPDLFGASRPAIEEFATRSNKEWIGWNEGDVGRLLTLGEADVLLMHEWAGEFSENQRHVPLVAAWPWVEMVVESVRPKIVFCGHLHARWRSAVRVGGHSVPVECLAQVSSGPDAFAVYEVEDGEFRALT